MRRIACIAIICVWAGTGAGEPAANRVSLERASYAELAKMVAGLRGKVVLVDIWGEFCLPCKKEFPNFAALHHKYAASGLAAVSVSLDDPNDPDAQQRALDFLTAQKATCRNLLLTDSPKVWQAKWKIAGPPCVFLFDQKGRLIHRWADREIDYQAIGQRVAELLKE